jgi:hypothetical protein
MSMVAMVPESFLLFVGPLSCGRFSAMNSFGAEGKYGYLYITDADISLGKVAAETVEAADTVIEKYHPKVLILLLTCNILIAGIDENAVLGEIRKKHSGTIIQSFPVNHIASGTGHDPVEMMFVRMTELFDRSSKEDAVDFIGSSMPPDCNSDINSVLEQLGLTGLHPVKAKNFDEFKRMGHAKYAIVANADGLAAAQSFGVPYVEMEPVYSYEEASEQYAALFKMVGKDCDLAPYRKKAEEAVSAAAEAMKGKTVSLGSSAAHRTFGLARLMLENGMAVTDVFITEESYDRTAENDLRDREWVAKAHPEVAVHQAGDTSMQGSIGRCCRADVAIGFNAAYMTDSTAAINVTDNGQMGFWPIVRTMTRIADSAKKPQSMKELMASYGVTI